jgi:hypothetical protein
MCEDEAPKIKNQKDTEAVLKATNLFECLSLKLLLCID